MEDFDLKELFDLWQKGKDINHALDVFFDGTSIKKQAREELKNNNKIRKTTNIGLLREREKQLQNTLVLTEYEKELLQTLCQNIKSHQLLAIGYREPVSGSDSPDLIPLSVWSPESIILEDSSLKSDEGIFSNVRITINPKRDIELSDYDDANTGPGRSTYEEYLDEAYEALLKKGRIDYTRGFNAHVGMIRKKVRSMHPELTNNKNLADSTIKKHLSPRFQKEKGEHLENL